MYHRVKLTCALFIIVYCLLFMNTTWTALLPYSLTVHDPTVSLSILYIHKYILHEFTCSHLVKIWSPETGDPEGQLNNEREHLYLNIIINIKYRYSMVFLLPFMSYHVCSCVHYYI